MICVTKNSERDPPPPCVLRTDAKFQAWKVHAGCREYVKATAVPKHLEKRRSELESEGYQVPLTLPPVFDHKNFHCCTSQCPHRSGANDLG